MASIDLEPLGLSPTQETVYRWLVKSGISPLSEVAAGARVPLAQARSAVTALERMHLVVRAPGRPARFGAAAPDIALEALLVARQQALEQTRLEVRRLQEEFRRASETRNPAELFDIVQGRESLRENVDQMWRSCREEILAFDKPPYAIPPEQNVTEQPLLASGVTLKGIYSKESLERPGALDTLRRFMAAGEQARFFPRVPMKLTIFDRRVARIPLVEKGGSVEGALVIHPSSLLDALIELFETLWERSFPFPPSGTEIAASEQDALNLSEDDARLITLLLAGTKSETIARQMNFGLSTVERRIKKLIASLDVQTRFQAGYELARRGFN